MTDTQKPSASPQQNRAAMATRARKIREAVKRAKLLPKEQERVAENMWRILEEAERQGVSKSTVLHQGGAGSEGDSTKRLARYAMDPELDPVKKQLRAGELTKGAERYLRIAEAAGRLAENDADAYVAMLFNGTRFAAAGDAAAAEDVYVELADLVRTVCSGVARRHDLQRVFRLCDERRLCYHDGVLRQNRDDRWSGVWRGFADGARVTGLLHEHQGWAMPYPSVLVGWSDLARDLPFRVSRKDPASAWDEPGTEALPAEAPVLMGTLGLEVRLALLPLGPGGAVEPAFVACPWVAIPFGRMQELWEEGPTGRWTFASDFEGVDENCARRGTPAALWHRGYTCQPQFGPEAWQDAFRGFAGLEPGHSYYDAWGSSTPVRIDLVSPASCRRYLQLQRSGSAVTGLGCSTVADDLDPALGEMGVGDHHKHWRDLDEGILDDPESPGWRTEPGTLAETLEYSLLSVPVPDRRFDIVLDRACARYAAEVEAVLGSVDGWREATKAQLRAKWSEAGPAVNGTGE